MTPAGPGLDSETRERAKRPLLTLHTRNFPTVANPPAGPGLDPETRERAKRPLLTLHTRNFPTPPIHRLARNKMTPAKRPPLSLHPPISRRR
jgi:hypothetical protein